MNYIQYLRNLVGHKKVILQASAAIILNDKNQVLMQHRSDNNKWGIIGGLLEIGEKNSDCIIREAKEEANIDIELIELQGIYHSPNVQYYNGDEAHVIVVVHIAKYISGELKINDDESLELKFFDLNQLPNDILSSHAAALEDYKNNIKRYID